MNTKNFVSTPNVALNDFFSDNENFADVFNTYLFGQKVLQPSSLSPLDTAYSNTLHLPKQFLKLERFRDLIRKSAYGMQFIILAIEDQDKVHYAMPLRVMLYDVLGYTAECKALGATQNAEEWTVDEYLSKVKKDSMLTPIFTIVFYTGEKKWDGPKSLHDMLTMDENIKKHIPDYPIHVIDLGHDDYDFQTEALQELSYVLRKIYDETIETDTTLVSNSTLSLAGILSHTPKLYHLKEGGKTIMCQAIQNIIDRNVSDANLQMLIELVKENSLTLEKAAEKAHLTLEEFQAAMNK